MKQITAYSFNELTKENQDKIIQLEITNLLTEIFYLPNCYEYPDDIYNELDYLLKDFGERLDDFIEESFENKLIYNYFHSLVIEDIKDAFFVPKLQKIRISETKQPVFLID